MDDFMQLIYKWTKLIPQLEHFCSFRRTQNVTNKNTVKSLAIPYIDTALASTGQSPHPSSFIRSYDVSCQTLSGVDEEDRHMLLSLWLE